MKRILIAGIGNIFLGDDAFGVEVVRKLARVSFPAEVEVKDFGIRGFDLACALTEDYGAAILVDATQRGEIPGTVLLIEPDLANLAQSNNPGMDGHSMDPLRVLQMAANFGGYPQRIYLIGCEPSDLGGEDGRMGLSEVVQSAVPRAVEMIQRLVSEILETQTEPGLVPA